MDNNEKALKRIAGQVRGIERMYAQEKPCLEIVQQVAAARQALGSVGRKLLKGEITKCISSEKEEQKIDKALQQLFKS